MTHAPLPLPPRFNLDMEPVPRPEPGAGTFDEIRSLYLKWQLVRPKTLICHQAVIDSLMRLTESARPGYLWGSLESLYGIPIEVDDTMRAGAWKLMTGGTEIDSGVIEVR